MDSVTKSIEITKNHLSGKNIVIFTKVGVALSLFLALAVGAVMGVQSSEYAKKHGFILQAFVFMLQCIAQVIGYIVVMTLRSE